ncbi:MAG TPA: SAM-dependent methyltransferase [Microscillaceae bacterium]|jgi:SAM-dependent methyltransferase|nr:SAM-dependent methyltransferase [Microscillaceae bacterium]
MAHKDLFSQQAALYATFRPDYPASLYQFILGQCSQYQLAWDVGCGNGQAARVLAQHFERVWATDLSQAQLSVATAHQAITYHQAPAEQSGLGDHSADLIAVAQAAHWFDLAAFYTEVRRVAAPQAVLAIWGYGLARVNAPVDAAVGHFYHQIVGLYWDEERRHIEQAYQSLPFPFQEVPSPTFENIKPWNLHHLLQYLSTWSAVQKYKNAQGQDPVAAYAPVLQEAWGDPAQEIPVSWDIFLKLAKL